MNTSIQMSVQVPAFNFSGHISRVEFVAHLKILSTFVRNHRSVFHSSYRILHPCQQCTVIPISSHFHQDFLFFFFLVVVLVLGFEFRTSHLLGRYSTTWATPSFGYFEDRVLLFAQVNLDHDPPILGGSHNSWDDRHAIPDPVEMGSWKLFLPGLV
jgi:hypothetical protein